MDSVSEERLAQVHPKLAEKVRQMAQMLEPEGVNFRVTQGLRLWGDQQALYDKGRNEQGLIVDPSAVVTKAKPGYSWHNFGLAVDVVLDDATLAGFQADWNTAHPAWQRLIQVGESLGLVSGSEWRTFPDWPHLQLTGRFGVSPDQEVRYLMQEGGLEAVWKESGL